MANASPHRARMARKANRAAADIRKLKAVLWKALQRAESMLDDDNNATVLKAIHALSQAAGPYLKAVEIGELEARLEELEAQAEDRDP